MVDFLHSADEGIVSLLGADDTGQQSYALSIDEMGITNSDDWYTDTYGFFYIPTDIRLENKTSNLMKSSTMI